MKRLLFNLATIVSLLLFTVSVALWVRSYFVFDRPLWYRSVPMGYVGVESAKGGICLFRIWDPIRTSMRMGIWRFTYRKESPNHYPVTDDYCGIAGHNGFGFGWVYDPEFKSNSGVGPSEAIIFPYPAISALLGIMAALFAMRFRRTRREYQRSMRGFCRHCGYDIRATPTRCPECGHVQTNPRCVTGG